MEFLTIRVRALFFLFSLALEGSLVAQGSEADCLLNGHTSLSPAGGFWVGGADAVKRQVQFGCAFLPAFKLSKFKIALKTKK